MEECLKVNARKCKILKFSLSWGWEHLRVRLGSEELEEVTEFKFEEFLV